MPYPVTLRFPAGQQLVTKIVTAPMACSAVMVPTTMFMGQVVTAYSPFPQQQGQTQTIALQTQSAVPADQQAQATTLQTSQQQGATQQTTKQQQPFLQVTKHAHSLILNLFRTVIHVHQHLNVNTPLVTFHIFLTDYSKSCLQILTKLTKMVYLGTASW